MSNAILNSNASSALISSLDSVSSAKNPFIYSYAQKGTLTASHVPAHSRTVVTSHATSKGFNQNIDFHVIKAGMLENAFLKFSVKNETDDNVFVNGALMNLMVEEIQLLTAGKVICSSKPFGRACIMSNKPYGVKKNLEKMYALNNGRKTLAEDAEVVSYIPLSFSCFDACELNYNTSFVEPLVVRVRLASANAYADDGTAEGAVPQNLTLLDCELVQVHRLLPSDKEQKQISENYADTESLVRVQYDLVEESTSKALTAGKKQTMEHTLTTNRVISKMFIALECENDAAAANKGTQLLGEYLELYNIKITGNGQTVLDIDGALVQYTLNQDTDSANSAFAVGNGWDASYAHTKNIYCVDFGMSKDPSHLTNCVSSREINDFKITITSSETTDVTAQPHRLRIAMVCPQLESINSASGKISTSLSS